jgi:hypothetical protein
MNCLPLTFHSLPPGLLILIGVFAGMALTFALIGFVDWLARRRAVRS